jgi:hypothetical protein
MRALDIIYGKWEDCYDLIPTYQAKLLRLVPGSVVELETEEHNGHVCFVRFFVALKPCIDGFFTRMQTIYCHGCNSLDRQVKRLVGCSCCSRWSQPVIPSGTWGD